MNSPRRLLLGIILASAILSGLLANDIVCLAFTPVLCTALLSARRDPIPYLVGLATSSNIGSAATLIGNPQNMYIGQAGNLGFAHYCAVMMPIVAISLLLCWMMVMLVWPGSFRGDGQVPAAAPPLEAQLEAQPMAMDRAVVRKTMIILAALVGAFIFLPAGPRVIAALIGGGLLLLSPRRESATLYLRIDWNLLLLFLGLFVVNGAMQQSGLTARLMLAIARSGVDLHHLPTLAGVTAMLSNIVSNVPAVLLLRPSIPQDDRRAWYLLALVSTFAGNLTLVGSIANLIVAEQAAKMGIRLDIKSYCRAGIPLTVLTVILGTAWVVWVMR